MPLSVGELQHLTEQTVDQPLRAVEAALGSGDLQAHLALLREHDLPALRAELQRLLARFGVARFVNEVVAPLNVAIGDAWLRGQLEIFEEHAYVEAMQTVLRLAIAAVPPPPPGVRAPRVLMCTFPGEPHGMGLLMVEALLVVEGCRCVSLGVQTPLWDIVLAAKAYRSDIVAISFTACMPPTQIIDGLTELRAKLPAGVRLWAGGSAPALHRRGVEGVHALSSLESMQVQLQAWRQSLAEQASPGVTAAKGSP